MYGSPLYLCSSIVVHAPRAKPTLRARSVDLLGGRTAVALLARLLTRLLLLLLLLLLLTGILLPLLLLMLLLLLLVMALRMMLHTLRRALWMMARMVLHRTRVVLSRCGGMVAPGVVVVFVGRGRACTGMADPATGLLLRLRRSALGHSIIGRRARRLGDILLMMGWSTLLLQWAPSAPASATCSTCCACVWSFRGPFLPWHDIYQEIKHIAFCQRACNIAPL